MNMLNSHAARISFVAVFLYLSLSADDQDPLPLTNSPEADDLPLQELGGVRVDTVNGASKFVQQVIEAPASVTIITADQIHRYGYRTLADALRSAPGLYVSYDRSYSYLGMRGF